MDNGAWKDEGEWSFDYNTFYAILSADMSLVLDGELPTASGDEMKSVYGVDISIESTIYRNAPGTHVTQLQNAVSDFPEFSYQSYWRLLDRTGNGAFEFRKNEFFECVLSMVRK